MKAEISLPCLFSEEAVKISIDRESNNLVELTVFSDDDSGDYMSVQVEVEDLVFALNAAQAIADDSDDYIDADFVSLDDIFGPDCCGEDEDEDEGSNLSALLSESIEAETAVTRDELLANGDLCVIGESGCDCADEQDEDFD